ncbi:DUF3667 domain-containing protein [Glycocaulis abyssi]|uniref:DUF3667 domain-containing protein n=1 Tax=Glycocaulis abyssi TaxID=1433403 RepID=A0ABV9NHJ1_9PROT
MTGRAHLDDTLGQDAHCRNCGASLNARYCGVCGQRALDRNERRFGHLLRDAFGTVLNLDGRFWRTFLALLFRPGRLSRDYIDGKRAFWLAPFTIFILVNLVYFLSPALTDFSQPFEFQVPGHLALQAHPDSEALNPAYREYLENWQGQFHSPLAARLVERRVAARDVARREASADRQGYTVADYRRAYEAINLEVSKLLIGLHVPFMALALTLLFIRKRLFFAEHFVSALHLFSFALLLLQVVLGPIGLLGGHIGGPWSVTAFQILMPLSMIALAVYFTIALRRTYQTPWWWVVPATVLFLLAIVGIHLLIYRPVQFLLIHALI